LQHVESIFSSVDGSSHYEEYGSGWKMYVLGFA